MNINRDRLDIYINRIELHIDTVRDEYRYRYIYIELEINMDTDRVRDKQI